MTTRLALAVAMSLGLALPGDQFQLWQKYLAQIAAKRAAEAELTCWAIEIGLKVAQIIAIAIGHFADKLAQIHIGLVDHRVQVVPREFQPVDFRLGTQTLLPVHLP